MDIIVGSMNTLHNSIQAVVKNNLCTGCGTCVGFCPGNALNLRIDQERGIYLPEIDTYRCNNCGICYKICPGQGIDFDSLNKEIFGDTITNLLFGNFINFFSGHANDPDIRFLSSSGGLITALLIYALEEKIIDGALVTRMNKGRPLEPEPFIARSRQEILEASRSKYCPVPANIVIKKILEAKSGEKFAVVGLPCHIQGIRKAEQLNGTLKDRIVLHLGIICSHTDSFLATEFLIRKTGISLKNVKSIEYRGGGWPGTLTIHGINNECYKIPYSEFINIHLLQFFSPRRCSVCRDKLNFLSDIAFGDAWGFKSDDTSGTSVCIVRSKNGEKFMISAFSSGSISLEKIPENEINNTQGLLSSSSIRLFHVGRNMNKIFGKVNPAYQFGLDDRNITRPYIWDYMKYSLFMFNYTMGITFHRSRLGLLLINLQIKLCQVPKKFLKKYS
jgi:coenzyme F420 hydrogenase subunit beta